MKSILLLITGGIAAYKALLLIRLLKARGIGVKVVMTKAAHEFITPLSVASLTGEKVYTDLFSLTDEVEMGHIELSRAADLVVVAPATANIIAKMAAGLCDDLASTTLLATNKPVLIAPSMNVKMWEHAATRRNIAQLLQDGVTLIAPTEGEMACGEFGFGRMAEPEVILAAIEKALTPQVLAGKHVVITAGGTREAIDPVRYISNHSSGKQGYAIAKAAYLAGANVTLISGEVALTPPFGVKMVKVTSADEMGQAVFAALPADIAICAAAVADFAVANVATQKIKKQAGALPTITFRENIDILKTLSHHILRPALVIGFAAETENVIENAKAKLAKKGCDMIVANDVAPASGTFGGDENAVSFITSSKVEALPKLSKDAVAVEIVNWITKNAG